MDFSDINFSLLIASLIVAATPILLAALGELVAEKSGVLNLGVEGMMIFGAISGFIITIETKNPWLGFLCSSIGGMLLASIFAVVTQIFRANQVASGLALTLFGLGFSGRRAHASRTRTQVGLWRPEGSSDRRLTIHACV